MPQHIKREVLPVPKELDQITTCAEMITEVRGGSYFLN